MKKIILAVSFFTVTGLVSVNANELAPFHTLIQQDSTTKVAVEIKDLPEPVQKTLQSDPVKAWTPVEAFLVTNADKSSYYLINVKKDQEVGSLKIDKDGKIIQ